MDIKKHTFETVVGTCVLAVALLFLWQTIRSGSIKSSSTDGITVSAKFNSVDGIEVGSDVKIAGVKVGVVSDKVLDVESYKAILKISFYSNVKVPIDSSAAVVSASLLGGKYISIRPGMEDKYLGEGGKIYDTQSSINLEDLIAKFAFGGAK